MLLLPFYTILRDTPLNASMSPDHHIAYIFKV
jgi:hypothetical protein